MMSTIIEDGKASSTPRVATARMKASLETGNDAKYSRAFCSLIEPMLWPRLSMAAETAVWATLPVTI